MNEYDKRKVSVKEIVDSITGEVIRYEKRFTKNVVAEEFIRVYLEDISGLMRLNGDVEFKVLLWLWKYTDWNNGDIYVEKTRKEEIAEFIGVKSQSVADALTRLVKKDILVKTKRTFYMLNPKYFFKGDDITRSKILSVNINYNIG